MTELKTKPNVHLSEVKEGGDLQAPAGLKTFNQIVREQVVHQVQMGRWQREIRAQAQILLRALGIHSRCQLIVHPMASKLNRKPQEGLAQKRVRDHLA